MPKNIKAFMATTFASLDRLGPTVSLKLNGSNEYKTVIGAFITVLTLGAALALTSNSFSDFIYFRNPSLSTSTEYDLQLINFNYSNFYFGVSFYEPVTTSENSRGIKESNYSKIQYINQLNLTCDTCEEKYQSSQMFLCAENQFINKTIKSTSKKKSETIMSLFKNYSFCFPEGINGTIEDVEKSSTGQDTTLSIYIPVSTTPLDLKTAQRNTESIPDVSNPSVTTKSEDITPPVTPTPVEPDIPEESNKPPTDENGEGGGPPDDEDFPPEDEDPNRPPGDEDFPSEDEDFPSEDEDFPPEDEDFPPEDETEDELDEEDPFRRLKQLRNLQNKTTTTSDVVTPDINVAMQETLEGYKFPKMLIINRSFELNPATTDIDLFMKQVYNLEVLDYKDPLSGNPIVYDIFVQKKKIIVTKPNKFTSIVETTEILTIQRIEKNQFDSIQNNGAYFQFKLYTDVEVINVKYILLADVLAVFGSYFTTFSLIGAILSSIYKDTILQTSIINSIFTFVDNDPKDFIGMEATIQKMLRESKMKKDIEMKLISEKEKEERMKKYRVEKDVTDEKQNLSSHENLESINHQLNDDDRPVIINDIKLEENSTHQNFIPEKLKTAKKIFSIAEVEKKTLDEKVKFISKLEEEKLFAQKTRLIEIYELNRIKKKKRKLTPIEFKNMLFLNLGCRKCLNLERRNMWVQVSKIVDDNLQIENIVKKNLDFEQLKKLLLTPKQIMLYKYYWKHVNYGNMKGTKEFLDQFGENDMKLDKEELEKNEYEMFSGKINNVIYENFKNPYNF